MFRPISYNYSEGSDIFRVVVQDKDTFEYNHVEVAIIDHVGRLFAELVRPMDNTEAEDDAVATALCYLDKEAAIEKYIDEETGELKWVNKVKTQVIQ